MLYLKRLLIAVALLTGASTLAKEVVVTTVADNGPGSLREVFETPLIGNGDSVRIDVSGVIQLQSNLSISGFDNVTIFGPYAKHLNIQADGGWGGGASLLTITACSNIDLQFIGFIGGGANDVRALDVSNNFGPVKINRCLFENFNCPNLLGGAILSNETNTEILSCSFIQNSAADGGALYLQDFDVRVENCTFWGNDAVTGYGGAIYVSGASVFEEFNHNTFYENQASINGTVIHAPSGGATIYMTNNAGAGNGALDQLTGTANYDSGGGNRFYTNFGEILPGGNLGTIGNDFLDNTIFPGLRSSILIDGYGLKYFPIDNPGSSFIDQGTTIPALNNDCRHAPRVLDGGVNGPQPDAGACEYTQLRVLNIDGSSGTPNSLAWALSAINAIDPVNYVEFDIPGAGPHNIQSDGGLFLNTVYIIDAYSQPLSAIPGPEFTGNPGVLGADIRIEIQNPGGTFEGLNFQAGSDGTEVKGLRIMGYDAAGITIFTNSNKIFGCEIGIDNLNNSNENDFAGINIAGGSDNQIGGPENWHRNVISGNGQSGATQKCNIRLANGSFGTYIRGNIIGANATGQGGINAAVATRSGVLDEGDGALIGQQGYLRGNLISGNDYGISAEASADMTVQNNKIGTTHNGLLTLPNTIAGITLLGGTNAVQIGMIGSKGGNLISANDGANIQILDVNDVTIVNNIIGLNKQGTSPLGASVEGIEINSNQANNVLIGGYNTEERNIITGNNTNGIHIVNVGFNCGIHNNYIGVYIDGNSGPGNVENGIIIQSAVAFAVSIGSPGSGNIISGHQSGNGIGVHIISSSNHGITANTIGLGADGTTVISNQNGIVLESSFDISVGGDYTAGAGNIVSGNLNNGLVVTGIGASNNIIQGNFFGTDVTGMIDKGNVQNGIVISGGLNNVVGGTSGGGILPTEYGNVISGNDNSGILLSQDGGQTIIYTNHIGLDYDGTGALGNGIGIIITDDHDVLIGGQPGEENYISGNIVHGILVQSSAVTIDGNHIGVGPSSFAGLGNGQNGIQIDVQGVIVGDAYFNVISNNGTHGIFLNGEAVDNCLIDNNIIGTDQSNTPGIGNNGDGIALIDGDVNYIGSNGGNTIIGNSGEGIKIQGNCIDNVVQQNIIADLTGGGMTNNRGILLTNTPGENVIGGTFGTDGNIIGNSQAAGLELQNSQNTLVLGNAVGNDGVGVSYPNGVGILISNGSNNSVIGTGNALGSNDYNLIGGNAGSGIEVDNSNFTSISGNSVGINLAGTGALSNGDHGIVVRNGSNYTTIGSTTTDPSLRNVISSNIGSGVRLESDSTTVSGNFIGLNLNGSASMWIQEDGVSISNGGQGNLIGGDRNTEANRITGNITNGVRIDNSPSNQVYGNIIGYTTASTIIGAQDVGVLVTGASATFNAIGLAPTGTYGNIIVGQATAGIAIATGAGDTQIYGNLIGIDDSEIAPGSQPMGIYVASDAGMFVNIGETSAGGGNVISGNGIGIQVDGASDVNIYNNIIGLNTVGTAAVPNTNAGIQLSNGASSVNLGGPGPSEGNIISGNGNYGIWMVGATTTNIVIEGNVIGLDLTSTIPFSNSWGIYIDGCDNNAIGSSSMGGGNNICGNYNGIVINNGDNNLIENNEIGLTDGNVHGIIIQNASSTNYVGGTDWTQRNIISNNDSIGIALNSASGNFVIGNFIGTTANGNVAAPNLIGVFLANGTSNQIGNTGAGEYNVISSNTSIGIAVEGGSANNLNHNFIGLDSTGNAIFAASGNGVGIALKNTTGNVLGGDFTLNEGNIICNNSTQGIYLESSDNNIIDGNNIGINFVEDSYFGNGSQGILLREGSDNNDIGDATTNFENAISANDVGVEIRNSDGNYIVNNWIGNNASGTGSALIGTNNQQVGVLLDSGATSSVINTENVISGHTSGLGVGVLIRGSATTNNYLEGNFIGVDATGNVALPNNIGVSFSNGTTFNLIGGAGASDQNVISGNTYVGVEITGINTDNNTIINTLIGVGDDETTALGSWVGISVNTNASNNNIGGTGAFEHNYIVNNSVAGILLELAVMGTNIRGNYIGVLPGGGNGGNTGPGIQIDGGSGNLIGGILADEGNEIAFNSIGVDIGSGSTTINNSILGNLIHQNAGQGIDINGDGLVLANDGSQGLGNNTEIDYPEIFEAFWCDGGSGNTGVAFIVRVPTSLTYTVEFFSNPNFADATNGEAEFFIERTTINPTSNPDTLFFNLGTVMGAGATITSTITGPAGNTSEFGPNYTVTLPPALPTFYALDETCLGSGDDTISITAPGAYYFSLNAAPDVYGNEGATFNTSGVGTHSVDINYYNGCVETISPITINNGLPLTFNNTIVNDTCGNNTGEILIDAEGGSPGPWTYSFDNGITYSGSGNSTGLAAGNYDLVMQDGTLGCFSSPLMVTVTTVDDIVDESFDFDDFCSNGTPLPYNIATNGGTFGWEGTGPTDGATINGTSGLISNPVAGNSYNVIYTVGLCDEVDTVIVTALTTDDPSFTIPDFCIGGNQITTPTLPGGTFSFDPDPMDGSVIDGATGDITGGANTYNVQYLTNGSCPDSVTIPVVVYGQPIAPIMTVSDSVFCENDPISTLSVSASGGIIDWYEGSLITPVSTSSDYTPVLNLGSTWIYVTETDANGCLSMADSVEYYLADNSGMFAIEDIEVCIGSEFQLEAYGGQTYLWDPTGILSDDNISNPVGSVSTPNSFVVQIIDEYNCVVYDTVNVGMLANSECDIIVYNAFSPNNDGFNDYFIIDGIEGYLENTVFIFNRWGDQMQKIENYNNTSIVWDGTNKSGDNVATGTYYFIVEVNGEQSQSGWIQVVK